jgi:hypothetical protein
MGAKKTMSLGSERAVNFGGSRDLKDRMNFWFVAAPTCGDGCLAATPPAKGGERKARRRKLGGTPGNDNAAVRAALYQLSLPLR